MSCPKKEFSVFNGIMQMTVNTNCHTSHVVDGIGIPGRLLVFVVVLLHNSYAYVIAMLM
jgi:hypothetical protein